MILAEFKIGNTNFYITSDNGCYFISKSHGKAVSIVPKEYALIKLFSLNENIMLTKQEILANVWGADYIEESRIFSVILFHLRQKLAKTNINIKTINKKGYTLTIEKL